MPARETKRVARALEIIARSPNIKAMKIHGSPYQEIGNPDIIACVRVSRPLGPNPDFDWEWGQMVVAEMKVEKGQLSAIQIKRLEEWCGVGAKCIVSTNPEEVARLVRNAEGNWTPDDLRLR